MSDYDLETGEYIYRLTCDCCGSEKNRVWGFVSKNGDAHAVYYALLNVTEEEPRVGLTLSVDPWSEGTVAGVTGASQRLIGRRRDEHEHSRPKGIQLLSLRKGALG